MYFRKMFCIYNLYLAIQNRCNCCIYHKFFFRIVISLLSTLTLYSWLLRSRIKFPIKSTSIHPVKYCMYRSRKQWENVHRPGKIKKKKELIHLPRRGATCYYAFLVMITTGGTGTLHDCRKLLLP